MPSRPLKATATPGIFRRENRYVVVLRDRSGRQFKRSVRTLTEARDLKATMQTEVIKGVTQPSKLVTFAEYAEEWMRTYAGRTPKGIRPLTLRDYRRSIERDAIPFFGRMQLADIEPRDIKRYATHWADLGLSNNTVRLRLSPLRCLFATAFEDGLIHRNPVAGLRNVYGRRRQDEQPTKALTEDELRNVLDCIPAEHREFIRFMSETGLRIGEAVAARWCDVDLDRGVLNVRQRYYQGTIDKPKSRYGLRTIPLTQHMVAELRNRQQILRPVESEPLFCSLAGTMLVPEDVLPRVFKPAARKAGVPWANLHTLRHTCASRLFRGGWNAKQVQMMLGHHSPAFTLATYVHLLPDDLPSSECLGLSLGNTNQ